VFHILYAVMQLPAVLHQQLPQVCLLVEYISWPGLSSVGLAWLPLYMLRLVLSVAAG
jgi:hypothetical protein